MRTAFEKLGKLRGKSLREVQERARQELSKLSERLTKSATIEMSDAELLYEFNGAAGKHHIRDFGDLLARGATAGADRPDGSPLRLDFLSSLDSRDQSVDLVGRRFATERDAAIAAAERICMARFDLLGFADLSFGQPIDWRLEPVSGKRTPLAHWSRIDYLDPEVAGDKKVTWELNRHQHFVTLGQAYWLTGNEKYAEAFVSQAESWMDSNPPNVGINWASSLELAFRSIAWLWTLRLVGTSPSLRPDFVTRLVKYLIAHGRHIDSYLSHYFSP